MTVEEKREVIGCILGQLSDHPLVQKVLLKHRYVEDSSVKREFWRCVEHDTIWWRSTNHSYYKEYLVLGNKTIITRCISNMGKGTTCVTRPEFNMKDLLFNEAIHVTRLASGGYECIST